MAPQDSRAHVLPCGDVIQEYEEPNQIPSNVNERLKIQVKVHILEIGQKQSMINWRLEATTCSDYRFYGWEPDSAPKATLPSRAKTRHRHRHSRAGGESAFTFSIKNSGFELTPLRPISASPNQYLNVSYDWVHICDLQRNVTTVRSNLWDPLLQVRGKGELWLMDMDGLQYLNDTFLIVVTRSL